MGFGCIGVNGIKLHPYDFKQIEILKEYEENLPLLNCEGAKIQQVLLNLLRNGAQAMEEIKQKNPQFIIRAGHDSKRDMISVEVEDNGPGISEHIKKRIFEPFFTTKDVGVGTGLGLSISYFIITKNHGGEMTVDSILGKGTVFRFSLPINQKK